MPRIQEVPVDFGNLSHLDNGKMDQLLRSQLALISRDCINRPSEKKKRKISLVFTAEPVMDPDSGDCERVKLVVECRSRVPDFRSRAYEMRPTNQGFHFNRDFPDELDQQPLLPSEQSEKQVGPDGRPR
jgi:hypothetical protein